MVLVPAPEACRPSAVLGFLKTNPRGVGEGQIAKWRDSGWFSYSQVELIIA